MHDLAIWQYAAIGLVFAWSGFVRSGLGFGGAVLSLPFLLLIVNDPLIFLPIISVHLLFFAGLTIFVNNKKTPVAAGSSAADGTLTTEAVKSGSTVAEHTGTVDWPYLKKMLAIMIVPKLIGVFGLVTLPSKVLSTIIFCIVAAYSLTYIMNRPFRSNSKVVDTIFLMLGGYISGTSLIGAPLIIAVAAQHLKKAMLRDTLFALWFILVSIKMVAFLLAGVDLQLIHHLWLLPCAAVGHVIGLRFHERMLRSETAVFFRVLGTVLLVVSVAGIVSVM